MSASLFEAPVAGAVVPAKKDTDSLGLLDVLPVLVWRSGRDARCDYFNRAWLEFTGRRLVDEVGNGWAEGVHPEDRERCVRDYLEAFESRRPFALEYRLRHRDGGYRWIRDLGRPSYTASGEFTGYLGGCIDITEIRDSREELRTLASRLGAVREEERVSIALNLHDELSQVLTVAKLDLSLLENAFKPPKRRPSVAHVLRELRSAQGTIEKALLAVRRIVSELRPAVLNELGLAAAVEWLARDFQKRTRVRCKTAVSKAFSDPDRQRSIALYRILQEALTNVARHAHATKIEIDLGQSGRSYTLRIRDDGIGVPEDRLNDWRSLGLNGMRERALMLDGTVVIERGPDGCTTVTASIPRAAERQAGAETHLRFRRRLLR